MLCGSNNAMSDHGMLNAMRRRDQSPDAALRALVEAIVANNEAGFSTLLDQRPDLATAPFLLGATRQRASTCFLAEIGHYVNIGDTALHFAAASYRHGMASRLIVAGADVRAKNRRGTEPL